LTSRTLPRLLILNQMAGPMTWELAEDLSIELGQVALLTGHPDTLEKGSTDQLEMFPAPMYQRGSFARRGLSWFAYCWKAFFWLWRWPAKTPMLIFSNPPVLVWVAWLVQKLRKQPYAVMVHDIYPDVLVRLQGFSEQHLLIRIWRWLNRQAYQSARVVMTLGEYMAANLESQFDSSKTPAGKVEIVYPWVDTEKIHPIPKQENWFAQKYDQVGKLTVMYSGNMGLGHDIETMLEAARLLKDEPDIHFMFIGAGPKYKLVADLQKKYNLDNVTLLGWQPEEILPFSLATADISLVSLERGMEGYAIPSKAIYGLATGACYIVLASRNNELVVWADKFCTGIFSDSSNAYGLANIIYYKKKFSEFKKTQSLCQIYFSRLNNFPKFNAILNKYVL